MEEQDIKNITTDEVCETKDEVMPESVHICGTWNVLYSYFVSHGTELTRETTKIRFFLENPILVSSYAVTYNRIEFVRDGDSFYINYYINDELKDKYYSKMAQLKDIYIHSEEGYYTRLIIEDTLSSNNKLSIWFNEDVGKYYVKLNSYELPSKIFRLDF